ncbi:translation initiation factor IF-3 [bacterium]|nr:translation initiation factor IF-3 [bacterium]
MPKESVNEQISAREVRLIDAEGKQVGVVSIVRAREIAEQSGMDLVEISPSAKPPVCKIMDFSKYYYQKERKAREARKNRQEVQVKEVKFGPNTEEHDYKFKKKNAIKFLLQHDKVKFTVRFKGRQMAHKEIGEELLLKLMQELKPIVDIDQPIRSESRIMSMTLSPKKDIEKLIDLLEKTDDDDDDAIVEIEDNE